MSEVVARREDDSAAREVISSMNAGQDGGMVVTSIDRNDRAGAVKLFNAMSDAQPLNEHLGEIIYMVDYVAEVIDVQVEDENGNKTGETRPAVRTVIIDDQGIAYQAVSDQLVKGLRRLFILLGSPETWDAPQAIMVTEQRSSGARRFFQVTVPTVK